MVFEKGILRLTDANLNRAKEGLRVLEDVARFILEKENLSNASRQIRHELNAFYGLQEQSQQVQARDSKHDVGAKHAVPTRKSLKAVVMANAHRAEEALRVLEEFSQNPNPVKDLRYQVYEIEKDLLQATALFPFMQGALYVITDSIDQAREGLKQGASVLQLRDKKSDKASIKQKALEFKQLADEFNAVFIQNDYPDIALAVEADGVHLGQDDMGTVEARKILKPWQILGRSCHSIQDARKAVAEGSDYFTVGPIHATPTKEGRRPVTVSYLKEVVAEQFKTPFVTIGGLDLSNVEEVLRLGARNIAIVRAIAESAQIVKKIQNYASQN